MQVQDVEGLRKLVSEYNLNFDNHLKPILKDVESYLCGKYKMKSHDAEYWALEIVSSGKQENKLERVLINMLDIHSIKS